MSNFCLLCNFLHFRDKFLISLVVILRQKVAYNFSSFCLPDSVNVSSYLQDQDLILPEVEDIWRKTLNNHLSFTKNSNHILYHIYIFFKVINY